MFFFKKHKKKPPLDIETTMEILKAKAGGKCIFYEGSVICYVCTTEFSADSKGLTVHFDNLNAKGLDFTQEKFSLNCPWSELAVSPSHIYTYNIGWHLFYFNRVINSVLKVAKENSNNQNPEDRYMKIMAALLTSLATYTHERKIYL